eukprot:ANDGO_04524.mRNA.1 hypothetical protein
MGSAKSKQSRPSVQRSYSDPNPLTSAAREALAASSSPVELPGKSSAKPIRNRLAPVSILKQNSPSMSPHKSSRLNFRLWSSTVQNNSAIPDDFDLGRRRYAFGDNVSNVDASPYDSPIPRNHSSRETALRDCVHFDAQGNVILSSSVGFGGSQLFFPDCDGGVPTSTVLVSSNDGLFDSSDQVLTINRSAPLDTLYSSSPLPSNHVTPRVSLTEIPLPHIPVRSGSSRRRSGSSRVRFSQDLCLKFSPEDAPRDLRGLAARTESDISFVF